MQLMSDEELEEMFEEYEVFLKSLSFPIQQQIISQPVDLKVYIDSQTSLFSKTSNDKRKELLASYIDYSKQIETSNQIMQRKRYIVFSVPVKQQTNKAFEIAKKTAFTNENHIVNGLLSLKLLARPLNNLQLLRLLHVLFDYETAQLSPIQSDTIKEIITGGKEG